MISYAVSLGMPSDNILYRDYLPTAYVPDNDGLFIGTDVYPSQKPVSENSKVSYKAAVAHEIVGHREAYLQGWSQPEGYHLPSTLMEEIQASIRAARFAPGLLRSERIQLLRDAVERLPHAARMRDIKSRLHIMSR